MTRTQNASPQYFILQRTASNRVGKHKTHFASPPTREAIMRRLRCEKCLRARQRTAGGALAPPAPPLPPPASSSPARAAVGAAGRGGGARGGCGGTCGGEAPRWGQRAASRAAGRGSGGGGRALGMPRRKAGEARERGRALSMPRRKKGEAQPLAMPRARRRNPAEEREEG